MPHNRFPLQPVLQLREIHRDQCRQRLLAARDCETAAQESLSDLQTQLAGIRGRLGDAVAPGTLDVQDLRALKSLEASLKQQVRDCQQRRQTAADDSDRQQVELTEADQQVRILQRLADRRNHQDRQP
jgi:flagellar biosynthesis chaperone FliJ